MGKINKGSGILGGFSGKVGTVVGGNWRGIDTMRAVAKPRKGVSTQSQIDQRLKFALGTKFMSAKSELMEVGFKAFAVQMTGTNKALSQTLKTAITGVSPNFTIDYSKVMLSRGSLAAPDNAVAAAGPAGTIAFTWANSLIAGGKPSPQDKAILVAYFEGTNKSLYDIGSAVRSGLAGSLAVPGFSGKAMHTWMAFLSEDGKRVSNSVYTGVVNVV